MAADLAPRGSSRAVCRACPLVLRDRTTALHLPCLLPGRGAKTDGKPGGKAPCVAANQVHSAVFSYRDVPRSCYMCQTLFFLLPLIM